ncbi:putative serine protease 45 [Culicoides brevitarsis]|uniref:putative serine protease 45 n=1 Tax=Culicoides brevitarsis TaxID=469753 RepID=UPI00307BCE5A
MRPILIVFLFVCSMNEGFCQENSVIGDRCSLTETQSGICRLIDACPSVYQDREKHKKRPKLCGFHGTKPIVCCSDAVVASTTDTPLPTNAITSQSKPEAAIPSRTESRDVNYCERFGQFVYENITIPGETNFFKENRCSVKPNELFAGTVRADLREFPHMVLIGTDRNQEARYFCAGALISDHFVLTSAHCIQNTGAKYVKITGVQGIQEQYFTVSEFIVHPQYSNTSFYHDIGLLRLNRPVSLSSYTRPACLPFQNVNLTEPLNAFVHSTWEIVGDTGIQFMKVRLQKMDRAKCQAEYANIDALYEGIDNIRQICTTDSSSGNNNNNNNCQSNLGGPLLVNHPHTYCSYLLLGFSSFAKTCGFTQSPVVFTDVRPYMRWIERTAFNGL